MSIQLRKAQRIKVPLKISIAGPSGSGKSYSSLLMARGMAGSWEKVCVIDTENGSADLYSHLGNYNVISLEANFTPDKYIEAIRAAEEAGMEVIVIDSVTHVWSGKGGLLEYQNSIGGRYQDWAKTTPLYQKWLGAILQSPCDVIATIRKKTHYDISTENGKLKVEKKGMEDQIRDGFEYEVTVALTLNQNNMTDLSLVKDRTGLFKKDGQDFVITQATGEMLRQWKEAGIRDYSRVKEQIFDELGRLGKTPETKAQAMATIKELTRYALVEENYDKILTKLQTLNSATPAIDNTKVDALKAKLAAKVRTKAAPATVNA
jgi:hypothetical protein